MQTNEGNIAVTLYNMLNKKLCTPVVPDPLAMPFFTHFTALIQTIVCKRNISI